MVISSAPLSRPAIEGFLQGAGLYEWRAFYSKRSQSHGKSIGRRDQPLPATARPQPGGVVPLGARSAGKAKRKASPILLSVGYSACHWCHVMAHESFEDEATAGLMNELFVNIKVDREERPDIDRIYQAAQQLIAQRNGGWPLTMFLAHEDQRPFFGGTYFPKEERYGMPAFGEIMKRVAEYYSRATRRSCANRTRAHPRVRRPAAASTAGRPGAHRCAA